MPMLLEAVQAAQIVQKVTKAQVKRHRAGLLMRVLTRIHREAASGRTSTVYSCYLKGGPARYGQTANFHELIYRAVCRDVNRLGYKATVKMSNGPLPEMKISW